MVYRSRARNGLADGHVRENVTLPESQSQTIVSKACIWLVFWQGFC